MLSEQDVDLMAEWRDELTTNRQRPINVIYLDKVYDDFTGELIGETPRPREVLSVVTEDSSGDERYLTNGIEYEKGDIQLSISIVLIADIADEIERVNHDGKDYEILAMDKKGIGKRNRYEILGRLIT